MADRLREGLEARLKARSRTPRLLEERNMIIVAPAAQSDKSLSHKCAERGHGQSRSYTASQQIVPYGINFSSQCNAGKHVLPVNFLHRETRSMFSQSNGNKSSALILTRDTDVPTMNFRTSMSKLFQQSKRFVAERQVPRPGSGAEVRHQRRVMRIEPGRVMTDDQLMMAARAAGFSMIPPQDASDTDPETVAVDEKTDLSEILATYFARVRAWLPSVPAMPARAGRVTA